MQQLASPKGLSLLVSPSTICFWVSSSSPPVPHVPDRKENMLNLHIQYQASQAATKQQQTTHELKNVNFERAWNQCFRPALCLLCWVHVLNTQNRIRFPRRINQNFGTAHSGDFLDAISDSISLGESKTSKTRSIKRVCHLDAVPVLQKFTNVLIFSSTPIHELEAFPRQPWQASSFPVGINITFCFVTAPLSCQSRTLESSLAPHNIQTFLQALTSTTQSIACDQDCDCWSCESPQLGWVGSVFTGIFWMEDWRSSSMPPWKQPALQSSVLWHQKIVALSSHQSPAKHHHGDHADAHFWPTRCHDFKILLYSREPTCPQDTTHATEPTSWKQHFNLQNCFFEITCWILPTVSTNNQLTLLSYGMNWHNLSFKPSKTKTWIWQTTLSVVFFRHVWLGFPKTENFKWQQIGGIMF